ncbi:accessory gene regulator AgrB [Staphylococcus coagulans]|uniref:accessory gene regulator AgrB n=1 Tax=Staphylococcus coagulans TaxID=74706 RepID=UPI000679F6D9|nr:accessory gene regulator AgrB [Staphylococcus coagulans]AKS66662.1 accessory gene regulator AgrB [Staphylococcus schleiferi]MBA8775121.1 accessory regulator AgrB [Staphylococcus coagulans]MBT2814950.1 accessory gene regulator AgrB [Staphylococcus coagulans]MBT2817332.1 accessory gene regulator AgrB [Staphylococcus coagulans]MBT2838046.1 accessory gene regulator AgrB [Staphylococcus coagulans]
MHIIDNVIERLARKLQAHQNLSHVEFLKVRLGMQIVAINLFKGIVTYGLALLLNVFLYTLFVHIIFLILRMFSHGAHSESSLLCHVQNILCFVLLPWIIIQYDIPFIYLLCLSIIGWFLVVKYAPAATQKKPIKQSKIKGLKIKSIITATILLVLSLIIPTPFNKLITYAVILQSITLLPIFSIKEEI